MSTHPLKTDLATAEILEELYFFSEAQEGNKYRLNSRVETQIHSGELEQWLHSLDPRIEFETYRTKHNDLLVSAALCFEHIPYKRMQIGALKPYVSKFRREKSGGYFVKETKLFLPLHSSVYLKNLFTDLAEPLELLDRVDQELDHIQLLESRRTACAVEVEGKYKSSLKTGQVAQFTARYLQLDAEINKSEKHAKLLLNQAIRLIGECYQLWGIFSPSR